MSQHVVDVSWSRGEPEFTYQSYSRDHTWTFDGGDTVTASANPAYLGSEAAVDPEEAFVAALASCHMLTFLAIAAADRRDVDGIGGRDHDRLILVRRGRVRLVDEGRTLDPRERVGIE